jgi:hypothetical protein
VGNSDCQFSDSGKFFLSLHQSLHPARLSYIFQQHYYTDMVALLVAQNGNMRIKEHLVAVTQSKTYILTAEGLTGF